MRKRQWIVVTGRVQGVGFRYFTREIAVRLQLVGWVRNSGNGSVEMEVQGEVEALDIFTREVNAGPDLSYVNSRRVVAMPLQEGETNFTIRY